MANQENVEIVRRGYDAFGRGDIEGLVSLLDSDIEWVSPGPSDLPTAGRRHGHQQVTQFFASVNELYDFQSFEPQTFIAEDDMVVVLGQDTVVAKSTGNTFSEAWAHVFTVKDGKIVRFQEYIDTAAAVAQLRSAEAHA
ncbi:MAG: nuclear transport factor 2 family protein [Vicinamibacterales bacterium]